MDMKRIFLYAIVIAALALAGCGGGGGGTTMPDDMGPSPADQLAELERQVMALETALAAAGLNVDRNSTPQEIMDALDAVENMAAGTAREEALAAIRSALGVTGTQDAMMLAQMITDRLGPTGPAPTAKTMGVTFGIIGSSMPNNPGSYTGLNALARPGNEGERVFVRQGDSTTDTTPGVFVGAVAGAAPTADEFTAADQLNHDDMEADPANAGQMRSVMGQFSDGSATSLSKMFSSTTHERMKEEGGVTTTDTITVVTNMEDAGPLAWTTYYANTRTGITGMAEMVDHDGDADTDDVYALTLDASNHADVVKLLGGAVVNALPSARNQTFSFSENPDGDADTMDDNRVYENSTFNGVAGTVECTSTCTVVTDADAMVSSMTGTWRFRPSAEDPSKVMIPGVAQDDDYLAFGWWLRGVQDDDDDNLPYTVGTFATGSQVYTLLNVRANVEGTAEYSGPAAGKFARKTLTTGGEVATLVAGHFTADASLMAYFGGDDVAVNKQFTIRGAVTNFEDATTGHDIDAGWTVELGKAGFAASGSNAVNAPTGVTAADDTFYGEATGTGGAWQGRFFGNDGDADPVEPGAQFVAPSGVAGEFTGHFANGHVIGAFGATKD